MINGMDTAATIGFVGEKIGTILSVDVMAVIHGAVVEKLIYRRGDHGDPLVSETEFCEILEKLQKDRDLAEDFDLLLKRAGKKEGRSLDGSVMSICHEGDSSVGASDAGFRRRDLVFCIRTGFWTAL